eukprot:PhM_4_TR11210/c0_g1_i1/m.78177
MADEKKRVGVVVSCAQENGGARDQQQPFNFTEFQQQFYAEGDAQNPENYHTAYQCRKTSIVAGVSSDELITQHRKSIVEHCKTTGGVNVADLMGVTLSRRHTQSVDEYDGELEPKAYNELESFNFTREEEAAAPPS